MKYIANLVIFGIAGLVVGYLIFARFNGHYLNINDLFFNQDNLLKKIGGVITGAEKIRQNIFISGAVGAAAGLVIASVSKKK